MLLCEEYLKRNKINLPFVHHVESGYLFFKDEIDDKISRLIMSIGWDSNIYIIKFLSPSRNSLFQTIGKEMWIEWDNYESFLLNWANEANSKSLISSKEEVKLFAWETFCYCFDDQICKFDKDKNLLASLDASISHKERLGRINLFLGKDERLFNSWHNKVLPLTENYCYWLCDLVAQKSSC